MIRTPRVLLAVLSVALGLGAQAASPLNFLVIGDWGRKGNDHQRETAVQMGLTAEGMKAAFVLNTGDNFYEDGVDSVTDPLWKLSFEDIYSAPSLQVPWYSCLGNHDYRKNPQAQVDYTTLSARWRMPARYYSFSKEVAPGVQADFFVLDSNALIEAYRKSTKVADLKNQDAAAQLAWLDKALGESKARWKIVMGHHTIHSSSATHGDMKDMIRLVKPLLVKHKVPVYFNGHDHDMEVICDSGIYFITSGSGSSVRADRKANPTSLFYNGTDSAFLAASLSADAMDYRIIDWRGRVLYSGQVVHP